jgi:glyoxylate reductase
VKTVRPKVFITRKIPDMVFEKIQANFEVTMWEKEEVPIPRAELEKRVTNIDGLYCLLTEQIDRDLIEKAPNLKIISNMAVGYNNIDVDAASEKGIMVTNTPGVLTETTADLTFALLMATARRIVESEKYLRDGNWKTWSPLLLTGQDIHGATLGIIGLGRIGESVARRAKGFDMNILYHSRSRKPEAEKELGITYTSLETLLKESDFVCVLTPFTPETKNLIGKEELALMKKTSILINTARGGIVNEEALYDTLKSGGIWAAGLDVFAEEPVPLNHPLLTLPNVVVLPHIGSASLKTRIKMADVAAENLIAALEGRIPRNLVNKVIQN